MVGKLLEPEDSSTQLIRLLRDKNQQVRKNTALALMKMGNKRNQGSKSRDS